MGQTAETHAFANLHRSVPDGNAAGLSDMRSVASAITTIHTVRLKLQIAGEFNGDLYGYLRHVRSGTTNFCVLLNRVGRSAVNLAGYGDAGLNITFDDSGASGDIHTYRILTNPPPATPLVGTWETDGRTADPGVVLDTSPRTTSLDSFNGTDASGEWTLFLADLESGGTNMLVSWELQITGVAMPAITWSTPLDISYGTALGSAQLNASSPVAGTFAYSPLPGTMLNSGNGQVLTLTFTPANPASYKSVTTNVTINVLKAALTVTANSTNKLYGGPIPALSASYSGFVNGDTTNQLASQVVLATTATAASPTGAYPIAASGASNSNYSITYASGALTVTPAPLTISAINKSTVYGTPIPALSASYSGFVNGDTTNQLSSQAVLATTATAASPTGVYPITASGASSANYAITYVNGALTMMPAALTIAPVNTNKTYGAPIPALLASYSGFVNGDTTNQLSSQAVLATTATAASPTGVYPITASGASSSNYTITYASGALNVTPATLTIAAINTSTVFGAPIPALLASYSGFVNGDTTNSLTTQPVLAIAAAAANSAGAYPITASGATSTNYTITFLAGQLTITKASTTGFVSSSKNPSLPGEGVAFTLVVSVVAPGAGAPTGVVQFKIDGANSGSLVALNSGAASYTLPALSVGTHTVVAEYAGDSNFTGATNGLSPDQAVNTPPFAGSDTIERWPTNGTKVLIATLLGNDSDADGDIISFVSVIGTSANGAAITRNGDWIFYAPAPGLTNEDSFEYTVADSRGAAATGTVLVAVKIDEVPSPNLMIIDRGDGSYLIRFDGIPGKTYRIEYNEDVDNPLWQALGVGTADGFGLFQFIDIPPNGSPRRFYRSVYP